MNLTRCSIIGSIHKLHSLVLGGEGGLANGLRIGYKWEGGGGGWGGGVIKNKMS